MPLNCANCGAALEAVGSRNYFRCPYCESFHFPEETPDGIAVLGDESRFSCPVCSEKLVAASINGDAVRYCRTCRGFLSDNPTFARIVNTRRAEHGNASAPVRPFSPEELRRRIRCPRCQKSMDTHPYHGGGNAVIDTCHRCHLVWLDAGELDVIGRYPNRTPMPVPASPTSREEEAETERDSDTIEVFGFRIRMF